jgi:hypothetical protein
MKRNGLVAFLTSALALAGCAGKPHRPCTDGGQPAREKPLNLGGNKRCDQVKDRSGQFVNSGKYIEWYPSGAVGLEGEYKDGKKSGKWIEWEEGGKKISERWFEDGVETQTRTAKDKDKPAAGEGGK